MNFKAKCKIENGSYEEQKVTLIHRRSNFVSLLDDLIDLDILNEA